MSLLLLNNQCFFTCLFRLKFTIIFIAVIFAAMADNNDTMSHAEKGLVAPPTSSNRDDLMSCKLTARGFFRKITTSCNGTSVLSIIAGIFRSLTLLLSLTIIYHDWRQYNRR